LSAKAPTRTATALATIAAAMNLLSFIMVPANGIAQSTMRRGLRF
jgi:Na+-driven multidrug efflux pump